MSYVGLEILRVLILPYQGWPYIPWNIKEKGDKTLVPNQPQNFSSSLFGLRVAMIKRGGQIRGKLLGIKCFLETFLHHASL